MENTPKRPRKRPTREAPLAEPINAQAEADRLERQTRESLGTDQERTSDDAVRVLADTTTRIASKLDETMRVGDRHAREMDGRLANLENAIRETGDELASTTAGGMANAASEQHSDLEALARLLRNSPALQTTRRDVQLNPFEPTDVSSHPLWIAIRAHSESISFYEYDRFLRRVLCARQPNGQEGIDPRSGESLDVQVQRLAQLCHLPGVDAYELLKTATEVFLLLRCGSCTPLLTGTLPVPPGRGRRARLDPELNRLESNRPLSYRETADRLRRFLAGPRHNYLNAIIRNAFPGGAVGASPFCVGVVGLNYPCLLELIWSYWMEEGMLVQTMAAITSRFENVQGPGPGRDPLGELEMDPLRPLSGFVWGVVQDEPHRLTVRRRAYEYNHAYGLTLYGRAVRQLRPADPRSQFLEAFHNLLRQAAIYYREQNDTTVIPDPFPVLNALKEVHLILAEGAHNQFRDLPWTARAQMLMDQWILARPEMTDYLRGRFMVAYPEPWMGPVDAMKRLQGWTETSVLHFNDLAVFGERILLSIRYFLWTSTANQQHARAWLHYWRQEVQAYIHAYHAATGVSLSDDVVEVRRKGDPRYLQPSLHLRNRLLEQRLLQVKR